MAKLRMVRFAETWTPDPDDPLGEDKRRLVAHLLENQEAGRVCAPTRAVEPPRGRRVIRRAVDARRPVAAPAARCAGPGGHARARGPVSAVRLPEDPDLSRARSAKTATTRVLAPVAVDRSPSPPRSWAKTAGSPQVHLRDARRWCADAGRPTRFKPSSPSPTDAVRDGSATLGHPVQNVTREHGLTPLPR